MKTQRLIVKAVPVNAIGASSWHYVDNDGDLTKVWEQFSHVETIRDEITGALLWGQDKQP